MMFDSKFIGEAIEEKPFLNNSAAQKFFAEWCKINDAITPEFIGREEWEKKGGDIFVKQEMGSQILFLPEDLQLAEMVKIIRAIDEETFHRNPDLKNKKAKEITELGRNFQQAGIYLKEYLPFIEDGKAIAEEMSEQFLDYGFSIQKGMVNNLVENTSELVLTEIDKNRLDQWFLGKKTYQKRIKRLGPNITPGQKEEERRKLLRIYFKGLSREAYQADGEPWEVRGGVMGEFQDATRERIERALKTPEIEMRAAVLNKGVEELIAGIKEYKVDEDVNKLLQETNLDMLKEQKRLFDVLKMAELKKELNEVRQAGNTEAIAKKEFEVGVKIFKAVRSFPYQGVKNEKGYDGSPSFPARIKETQFLNCVGYSVLAGGLLTELDISYLYVDEPGLNHAFHFWITADGKVYWADYTNALLGEIEDNKIAGKDKTKEITEFVNDSKNKNLPINISLKNEKRIIYLSKPELGQQVHILNNLGITLNQLGRIEEAVLAHQAAVKIEPDFVLSYFGWAEGLAKLKRYQEAIEVFRKGIAASSKVGVSNSKYAPFYRGLADAISETGKYEEAIKTYRQILEWDPNNLRTVHHLCIDLFKVERYQEAIDLCNGYIGKWPKYDALAPNYIHLVYNLANGLNYSGEYEEAIRNYRKAIGLAPNNLTYYLKLGDLLKRLGKIADLKELYGSFINGQGPEADKEKVRKFLAELEEEN